jgi:hypothetical protein
MRRPTRATIDARTEEVLRLVLDGAQPWDLRQYVSEQQAVKGSPWELHEGDRPLSDRQLQRYAVAAEKRIAESHRTSRRKLLRRHLAQRRNLFAKAVTTGDLRTALAVASDEAQLLRLYDRPAVPKRKGEPAPTTTADVETILARQLAQVDQSDLPPDEKTRLLATLADALIRARHALYVERQIADLVAKVNRAEKEDR